MGHKAATDAAALPVASDQLPEGHGSMALPDGSTVQVGPCFSAAEAVFYPGKHAVSEHCNGAGDGFHFFLVQLVAGSMDLTQALTDCGMSVDPAIREMLFSNAVLFGGGTQVAGLRSRLLLEAREVAAVMVSTQPVHMRTGIHLPFHSTGPPHGVQQQLRPRARVRPMDRRQHPGLPAFVWRHGGHTSRVARARSKHSSAEIPMNCGGAFSVPPAAPHWPLHPSFFCFMYARYPAAPADGTGWYGL